MRAVIIAGNWKMYTRVAEARSLAGAIKGGLKGQLLGVEVVLCPPFVSLSTVREVVGGSPIKVGAQNVHFLDQGAYTGEISAGMLEDLCQYVIIGHSERRQHFQESDDFLRGKVEAVLRAGLRPILCVGETLEQYEGGQTDAVVQQQLQGCLAGLPSGDNGLVVAYEPVWAIGTGRAATATGANATIAFIRRLLEELLGGIVAETTPILYGGSVSAANSADFLSQPEIDGALVGGASLRAEEFLEIIQQAVRITGRG